MTQSVRQETFPKGYAHYSYWLASCGDDLTPRVPLDGSVQADVAILGAGFSGLWTAYYLLQRAPQLRVVLIEKEIAGFGGSGRNGGWCSSGFPVSLRELARRFGRDAARRLHAAMMQAVDEVGRVAARERIDCDYEKGGNLRLARGAHQMPVIRQMLDLYEEMGFGEHYHLLSREETAQRLHVSGVVGSLYSPHCATVHPGKLVRGLARVVEARGAVLYEQTAATGYAAGKRPVLHTARGDVQADVVVLAGEAYLSQLGQLARQLIPIYSLIVLTEPLTTAQWQQIGWAGRECVASSKFVVDYLSRTVDGRILFGGRGAPYHFASRIKDAYDRHAATHNSLREAAMAWFPSIRREQFSHAWGGPLGVSRDWMPTISFDRQSGIASACGYAGQGVSTTNLAGRILADLITDTPSELTALPMVGHTSPRWECEPLRYLGVRYVQQGYARLDRKAQASGVPADGSSLVERLSRH
jgi:glycine/D-amino acid oxidase-like deaminating enzyme